MNYTSPLHIFRSYRLSPFFHHVYSLRSPTYSHKINPKNVFCRFELHGVCNDDKCLWQHTRDITLSGMPMIHTT